MIIWCGQCRQNSLELGGPFVVVFVLTVVKMIVFFFVSQILFGKSARATLHVLQQIKVEFASNVQCRENASKPATITDKVMCAGNSTGNRNACKGDRCSPIVVSLRRAPNDWRVLNLLISMDFLYTISCAWNSLRIIFAIDLKAVNNQEHYT